MKSDIATRETNLIRMRACSVYLSFWIAWIMGLSESRNSLDTRAANTNPTKEMEPMITKKLPHNFISVK